MVRYLQLNPEVIHWVIFWGVAMDQDLVSCAKELRQGRFWTMSSSSTFARALWQQVTPPPARSDASPQAVAAL